MAIYEFEILGPSSSRLCHRLSSRGLFDQRGTVKLNKDKLWKGISFAIRREEGNFIYERN